MKNDRKAIEIITPAEVRLLFPHNWKSIWDDDRVSYLGNKLAACTGMRAGEIIGLQGEYVYDDYIHVCAKYDEYGYRPTKTKEKRNIPIAPFEQLPLKYAKYCVFCGTCETTNQVVEQVQYSHVSHSHQPRAYSPNVGMCRFTEGNNLPSRYKRIQ